jgi:hypothetical protein
MSLGSSGLEILGAIRELLIANRAEIEAILQGNDTIAEIVHFVDKMYGRT